MDDELTLYVLEEADEQYGSVSSKKRIYNFIPPKLKSIIIALIRHTLKSWGRNVVPSIQNSMTELVAIL